MLNSRANILLFLILYQQSHVLINCQKSWTYELTDIVFKTSDADFFDADLQIVRISRGMFGISGYVDIKQPLDETSSMEVIFYRDKYCQGNYEKQLYSVDNSSFPEAMDKFYKKLLMDSFKKCATEAPVFDTFEPPLTKRCMILDNCQISTDNLPSYVDDGCYYASINIYGQVEVSIKAYVVVENKFY